MSRTTTKRKAVLEAADLAGDFTNGEYVRGMCELLARCFPAPDTTTHDRAETFELAIRLLAED